MENKAKAFRVNLGKETGDLILSLAGSGHDNGVVHIEGVKSTCGRDMDFSVKTILFAQLKNGVLYPGGRKVADVYLENESNGNGICWRISDFPSLAACANGACHIFDLPELKLFSEMPEGSFCETLFVIKKGSAEIFVCLDKDPNGARAKESQFKHRDPVAEMNERCFRLSGQRLF